MKSQRELRSFRRIARLQYGDALAAEQRQPGNVSVYGSNGIVGTHETANTTFPCVLLGRKGSFGKLNFSEQPCYAIDTVFYVDPRHTRAHLRWIYYCLLTLGLDQTSRDSAVPGLDREEVHAAVIPYCTLSEQIAVAAFLDRETSAIDDLIAKKQRLIELLGEKRAALISRAVTQGLNPDVPMKDSGVEWLGCIPADWTVGRLKYLCKRIVDGIHHTPEYIPSGVPFLTVRNLTGSDGIDLTECKYISAEDHSEFSRRANPEIGDLLITKDGTLGTVRVIEQEPNFSIFVSVALIKLGPRLSPLYAKLCLESDCTRVQFESRRLGSALQHLHLEEIGDVQVAAPPLPIQKEIEKRMSIVIQYERRLTSTLIAQVDLLREYRSALITAAVTGQLDIPQHEKKLEALA